MITEAREFQFFNDNLIPNESLQGWRVLTGWIRECSCDECIPLWGVWFPYFYLKVLGVTIVTPRSTVSECHRVKCHQLAIKSDPQFLLYSILITKPELLIRSYWHIISEHILSHIFRPILTVLMAIFIGDTQDRFCLRFVSKAWQYASCIVPRTALCGLASRARIPCAPSGPYTFN